MTEICAVIVTYNRLTILMQAFKALVTQSKPFRKIYIVDNASTDGTSGWCENIQNSFPGLIEYYRLDTNEGGAGGFYYGIRKAYEDANNQWVVVLDDDAILPDDYNSRLEKAISDNSGVSCFTGNVLRTENGVKVKRVTEACEYTKVKNVSFVSATFDRNLITRIGFPEKDYFIWFDDNEYSLRVIKHSDIVSMNNAVVDHLQNDSSVDSLLWKKYYGIRNNLHMIKKHSCRIEYYFFRSKMWIRLWISSIIKQLYVEKSMRRYKLRRTLIKDAFRDSKNNKLGINNKYLPGNGSK